MALVSSIGGSNVLLSGRSGCGPSQFPSAGAGVAGNDPGAGTAPDHFSTRVNSAGTRRMSTELARSMPPITVVPMIWRATEPAPEAVHNGTQPRMNANEVIEIG